jgi:uncharacterized membrane protein YoaK (UPF0700 family)
MGVMKLVRRLWPDESNVWLPVLLILLTFLAGLVDGVTYISLGHVFVANMTGNIVFIGFALAGANISLIGSLIALACFMIGASIGGKNIAHHGNQRFKLLHRTVLSMSITLLIALVLSIIWGNHLQSIDKYILIVLLGLTMGLQNTTARALAVPDLTTTVLTMSITGLVADSTRSFNKESLLRRLIAVFTIFIGALVGGVFAVRHNIVIPIAIATALVLITLFISQTQISEKRSMLKVIG